MEKNIHLIDEGTTQKYILPEKDVITIGRSNHCDIVFSSCFVSRKHCEIERIPPHGTLLIKSCTTTNPTYLDALKLVNKAVAELRVGSLIGLGVPLTIPEEARKKNKNYIFLRVCHEDIPTASPEEIIFLSDSNTHCAVTSTSHEEKNAHLKENEKINSLGDNATHTAVTSSCQREKYDHLKESEKVSFCESKISTGYENVSHAPYANTSPVSLSSKNVSNTDIQNIKSPNESLWRIPLQTEPQSLINSIKESHHSVLEKNKAIESKIIDLETDSPIQDYSPSSLYNSEPVSSDSSIRSHSLSGKKNDTLTDSKIKLVKQEKSKCVLTALPSEIQRPSITEGGEYPVAHCIEELPNKSDSSNQLNHKSPIKNQSLSHEFNDYKLLTKPNQWVPTTCVQISSPQTYSLPLEVSKGIPIGRDSGSSLKTHSHIIKNSSTSPPVTFAEISSSNENLNVLKDEAFNLPETANTEESEGLCSIKSFPINSEKNISESSTQQLAQTSKLKACYVKMYPLNLPSLAHDAKPVHSDLVQDSTLSPIHRKKKRLKDYKRSRLRIISSDSESDSNCSENKRLKQQSISNSDDDYALGQEQNSVKSSLKKAQEQNFPKPIESDIKLSLDLTKVKIEKDYEPDDDVISYSQKTDEIILISSDEEETLSEPTNGDLSRDLSFGPLPFDDDEFFLNDFEKGDVDLGLPDLMLPSDQHKVSEHTPVLPPELQDLDSSHQNKSDVFSDDDRWWPILSQEFEEDDQKEDCEVLVEKESASIPMKKDLQDVIDKISSTTVAKSKLTEVKLPPVRKKGRKKTAKLQDFLPDHKEDKEKASASSICGNFYKDSSRKSRTSRVKLDQDDKGSHKSVLTIGKKPSKGLRDTILKTHNLEMYKRTTKLMHHVGKYSYTTGEQLCENVQPNKNMSIQPKKKGSSGSEIKKGIAKISNKSRNQMDLFTSCIPPKTQRATCNFRIPKKSKTLNPQPSQSGEVVISPLTSIEIPNKKKSDRVVAITNQPEKDANVNLTSYRSLVDNQNKIIHDQALKSILKRGPQNDAPKNKVLFREDKLESTLLIPPREKQDYLVPQNISFLKQRSNSNVAQNDGSHELFKFISKVCNWNCDWLTSYQQHKLKENFKPPPINKMPLLPTLIVYSSFEDYKNTFLYLMYYEVWEHIFKDWEKYVKTNMKFSCEILSNDVICRFSNKFSLVKAICLISNDFSLRGYHPAVGSLIIMSHKKGSKRGNTFGYISNVIKQRDLHIPQHLRSISMPGANTPIVFEILLSKPYVECEIRPQSVVEISNVSYIRSFVKGFESIGYLRHSKLCKTIIDPSDLNFFYFKNQTHEYLINQISLNQSQQNAVTYVSSHCFEAQNSPQISLIHGPPGTGKTRVIAALISQIILMFKRSEYASYRRILLCAPSNAAVDELVIKLIELKKINIDLNIVRIGVKHKMNPLVEDFSQDVLVNKQFQKELLPKDKSFHKELEQKRLYSDQAVKDYKNAKKTNVSSDIIQAKKQRMDSLLQSQTNFEESSKIKLNYKDRNKKYTSCQKMILMKAEVIATTLTSCLSGPFFDFFSKSNSRFACCIIDEAGQSKETEMWFPLRLGINKLILVGDHQQLPATVLSQISQGKNLHQSLFERLYHHIGIERDRLDLIHCLDTQYRMHEAIAAWPAKHFYCNNLKTPASVTKQNCYALQPYMVFDVQSDESRLAEGEIFNLTEVYFIQSLIEALEVHLVNLSIGILTPYQKQKMALLDKLDYLIKKHNITISTVDNFQGQEKDVIICSFVRANKSSKIGFVSDKQRLNVSLTRARKSCFLVGNIASLQSSPDWMSLVQDARKREVLRKIGIEMFGDKEALLRMALV